MLSKYSQVEQSTQVLFTSYFKFSICNQNFWIILVCHLFLLNLVQISQEHILIRKVLHVLESQKSESQAVLFSSMLQNWLTLQSLCECIKFVPFRFSKSQQIVLSTCCGAFIKMFISQLYCNLITMSSFVIGTDVFYGLCD